MNLILTSMFRVWLWCGNTVRNEILSSEIRKAQNPLFCCAGTHFDLRPLKSAQKRVAHSTAAGASCRVTCVWMCACVHLLLHIQRDSTCTSKRQLGFQICNQVHGADFFVSSRFLLGQSILRSFITGVFYRSLPLALTWARWSHSTPSNTSSFRYMLGAFWRSSEKWVIASVLTSLCMAVRS
jgi:hypothetical protein